MSMKILTIACVVVGTFALICGMFMTRKIIREAPRARFAWHSLFGLIFVFVIGYAVFLSYLWYAPYSPVTLVASLIFSGGGVFVFLVTKQSFSTIKEIKHVTELEIETDKIRSVKQRLEAIVSNTAEGIITFYEDGTIDSVNTAAEKLFGCQNTEVKGKPITTFISCNAADNTSAEPGTAFSDKLDTYLGRESEVEGRHCNGSTRLLSLKLSKIKADGVTLYTGLVADISERKALLDHFKYLAEHDDLTGLYNRSYFQRELEQAIRRYRQGSGPPCAVMYIDMDNFKYINDTLGHAAGDRLIKQVGRALSERVRELDVLARFGGDEFTVILYDVDVSTALEIADSFRTRLADLTFRDRGSQLETGCSIGIAAITKQDATADEVLSQADFACHQAKHDGRNRVRLFSPEDEASVERLSADMGWSRRIKTAIDDKQFVLACQPIVNTQDRIVDCFEILVRMKDADQNLIMPGGFMPSAERFGHMVEIDKWVIVQAIESLVAKRESERNMRYSINLSAQTLTHPGICELVESKLEETGLEAGALTFETSESAAISDLMAADLLFRQLRSMGCRTALDDFGSGLTSFAYLRDFPVDIVKIDGRFVKNMPEHTFDLAMVKAMNDIAHAMGKQTVAEFVDSEAVFNQIAEIGVDFGQGYYLGRPHLSTPCEFIDESYPQFRNVP